MKITTFILAALLVLAAVPALAGDQPSSSADAEKEAIIQTALDYSDGAYSNDPARMERAIHPDLNKLIFGRRSPAMGLASSYSTYSLLLELLRAGRINSLEPEKRRTETAVLEIQGDVACVKVRTALWFDYLQMIKVDGKWKIINVLWTNGYDTPPEGKAVPGFDGEKERPAARTAALDFIEGRLTGDVARLEKVLHPETNLVAYMVFAKTNKAFISRTRYSGIMEPAKAKLGLPPENARKAEVRVLDVMDGMAFAVAQTPLGTLYLQLQLMDGQWKAINILFRPANNLVPQLQEVKK